MKLVRFLKGSTARIGVIDHDQVVDVEGALTAALVGAGMSLEMAQSEARERVPQSMRRFLAAGDGLQQIVREAVSFAHAYPDHKVSGHNITVPLVSAELLAPIADPEKIICIGQNYKDHCAEQNQPFPERAIIFAKFPNAINNPGAPVVLPAISSQVDYEAELAFVVGKRAKHVSEADAPHYIAGYFCLNDVSARDIQMHPAEKQWIRGKACDGFAPIGPWLVTSDEVGDPHDLDIELVLNGEVRQTSNTSNLIFNCYYLLSYISKGITLEPGDIVTTGTPGGVGVFSNPQIFLQPGDVMSVTIEKLGTLTNTVIAETIA